MRLLINALPMAPPLSGIGTCVSELSAALERHPAIEEVVYMAHWHSGNRAEMLRLLADSVGGGEREQPRSLLPFPLGMVSEWLNERGVAQRLGRSAVEWRRRGQRRRLRGYLYHEMNYIPVRHDGPLVITVQDLSFLHYPETFPVGRLQFFKHFLDKAVARADHLLTSTAQVRTEVIEHFGIAPDRVSATPLGLDHDRFHAGVQPQPPVGLPTGAYFLLLGNLEPRKNLGVALEAYESLPESLKADIKLVHAGPAGWKNSSLAARMQRLADKGQLLQLGYVPLADLPGLYRGACALVFPSLYEGFGLPLLEAMATGTPVVASDCPVLVEVGGGACLHFPASRPEELAAAMSRLHAEPELGEQLSASGLERAAQFSWERCAEDTVAIYQRVLSGA